MTSKGHDGYVLGIDEAGRGPVLGPMTYGCAFYPKNRHEEVVAMKFDDSKVLKEEVRDKMFEQIKNCDFIGWYVDVISAAALSDRMLAGSASWSLNEISYQSAMALIQRALDAGYPIRECYLDAVGDCATYTKRLQQRFAEYNIRFTVRPKADSLYKCVSAASICAKTMRDHIVNKWVFPEEGKSPAKAAAMEATGGNICEFTRNFGSGYPSDVRVPRWMEKHLDHVFGFPNFCRFSWETTKIMLESSTAKVRFHDEMAANGLSKFGFGSNKRYLYFRERQMELCSNVFA